ncbi:hypothetical protein R6Q59_025063 [Mikania micrantha]
MLPFQNSNPQVSLKSHVNIKFDSLKRSLNLFSLAHSQLTPPNPNRRCLCMSIFYKIAFKFLTPAKWKHSSSKFCLINSPLLISKATLPGFLSMGLSLEQGENYWKTGYHTGISYRRS